MATKPDMLKWVPDDDAAKIEDPGSSKKTLGFIYQEKPAFQFFNYLFNRIYKWFRGLQGSYVNVVVGSSAQVTANEATHTINQLNNSIVTAGSRVLFLEGTHTLTADLTLTSANVSFESENGAAIIDLASTYKFKATGARVYASMKFSNVTNATDAVEISGASSNGTLLDISPLNVTGSSSGVITCVGSSASVKVGGVVVPEIAGALTDGANIAWDLATSQIATVTLGGDRTLSNPTNKRTGKFTLIVTQDGTGNRALTFGSDYKGTKVFVTPTAGAKTVIEFTCDGTDMMFPDASNRFTTGDGKLTLKTSADPGWVMANDGTIGNASSGATTRAKADTIDLYTVLWNNCANSEAQIQDSAGTPTTRGASAAADFAANKRIRLTQNLGRAIAIAGAGAGLTSRALGVALGEETHVLTTNEMPAHNHRANASGSGGSSGGDYLSNTSTNSASANTNSISTVGADAAHNNMQPSAFWNAMVKL